MKKNILCIWFVLAIGIECFVQEDKELSRVSGITKDDSPEIPGSHSAMNLKSEITDKNGPKKQIEAADMSWPDMSPGTWTLDKNEDVEIIRNNLMAKIYWSMMNKKFGSNTLKTADVNTGDWVDDVFTKNKKPKNELNEKIKFLEDQLSILLKEKNGNLISNTGSSEFDADKSHKYIHLAKEIKSADDTDVVDDSYEVWSWRLPKH